MPSQTHLITEKDTNKCNIERLTKTSNSSALFICGDIELNPGPVNNSITVLTSRLAGIGLRPVNIVGGGNCFFHSVSHQLYGTESCHSQIRALTIQYLINCPENFIESNTDQLWLIYLQNMLRIGTWADHLIIQAVANANNPRICITESAANFSETSVVTSIYAQPGGNTRDIYIGHVDELHYVSTSPILMISAEQVEKQSEMSKNISGKSSCLQRRDYMREYTKKRLHNKFRINENERKKEYNEKYKTLNPGNVNESCRKGRS